jgi:uncharacterized protein (DUF305 family)
VKRTLIAAAAGALLLTACGSDHSGASSADHEGLSGTSTSASGGGSAAAAPIGKPAAGPHNIADVSFAAGMIPHHASAVTMSDQALTKATHPKVKALAAAVKKAQSPEIATMSGWLSGWGQPVPSPTMGMQHGDRPMPGTMSAGNTGALEKATGSAFDKLWITQMITHHKGAVSLAKSELTHGQNPEAKALAQTIIDAQSKEIAQLTQALTTMK